uniref:Uncharacterized protein n=1 Tax=Arundo donax TaxID=35708 RepID=A0A0A9GDF8_ARUDO
MGRLPLRSGRNLPYLMLKGSAFCFHLRGRQKLVFICCVYFTGVGSSVCDKVELMILQGTRLLDARRNVIKRMPKNEDACRKLFL